MSHRKIHLLEKIQVELAIVAALAVVYFWAQQYVRPWDQEAAIAFIPYGNLRELAVLAACVWAIAAGVALLTARSRPEGALAAVLIGAGGFSLRSPRIRTLMWLQEDGLRGMFGQLMIEMVLLTVVIIGAIAIIALVRRLMAAVHPSWIWRDPMLDVSDQQRRQVSDDPELLKTKLLKGQMPGGVFGALLWQTSRRASRSYGKKLTPPQMVMQVVTCVVMQAAVIIVLMLILLRSSDRGQIIFSVLAACLLAALLAHQFFPVPLGALAWLVPMVIGTAFYILAAVGSLQAGADAWTKVQFYAKALPIDWFSAGAGGGVLGFWISERIHELRHMEKHQEKQAAAGKST